MKQDSSRGSDSSFDHFSSHYEECVEDPLKAWIGENSSEYYLRLKAEEINLHLHSLGLDPAKLVALDVGCGTGAAASMVYSRFAALYGVDSSRGMIERARQLSLPGVSFEISDGKALPFEKNFFDFIYSMSLFHHVSPEYRLLTLEEMVRALKPGGWIFTFEHNALNPLTQWIVRRCPLDAGVELLHAREMIDLYRQVKLDAIHTRFILFFPKQLKLFRRFESYLSWLPLGGQFYVCGRKLA
jgi:SAM-dependent methyltransferase